MDESACEALSGFADLSSAAGESPPRVRLYAGLQEGQEYIGMGGGRNAAGAVTKLLSPPYYGGVNKKAGTLPGSVAMARWPSLEVVAGLLAPVVTTGNSLLTVVMFLFVVMPRSDVATSCCKAYVTEANCFMRLIV